MHAPFGLKWSGNSLVRAVQITLSPLGEFADSYVDDMSVFSDVWLQHLSLCQTISHSSHSHVQLSQLLRSLLMT